jgi:hypothetical protein
MRNNSRENRIFLPAATAKPFTAPRGKSSFRETLPY